MNQTQNLSQKHIHAETSLLEQAINVTWQTERSEAEQLLRTLSEEALKGTISWDSNLIATINAAIKGIDEIISKQLAVIMHQEKFKKLEGSWRGLHYFVTNTETNANLRIKVLNISREALGKDLSKASEFDQSQLYKLVYETEFGAPGGEPYGALIGDYEFSNHPEDIELLTKISNVAAAGFCPFISAASPKLFGFNSWTRLSHPRDLESIFNSVEYAKWRSLRESEDSRFLTLTMPRVLARAPYGQLTRPIEEFNYEEGLPNTEGKPLKLAHDDYCWMNAAYALGTRLTNAFSRSGWCTAIRGPEGGGRINNLPLHTFISDDGDLDAACPTEIGITDRREAELGRLGFLPLCHYKNTDYAVFFGAQTLQKAQKYDKPEATANAAISARLPYLMATSRFAHYLKVMGRDKIGSFMEAEEVEAWLNNWLNNYVNGNAESGQDMKARFPLAEARVQVEAVPGRPGAYQAVAWLRPWLQLEELTTSLRLVANIPQIK
ncbi:MAG TPA: type VI secretion system contractile sheath large subunit [Gammaproteobacteria bacterium]|nr:type VI secretion system contractile sheath large subunit [Gammaproteobacteria bacterium]